MIAHIARGAVGRVDRERLRDQLVRGPWLWPAAHDAHRVAFCAGISGLPAPAAPPGAVLLVAVGDECDSLWSFGASNVAGSLRRLTMGRAAQASWWSACALLPRVLPVLWRSVREAGDIPLEADCLVTRPGPRTAVAPIPAEVDGRSFGLPLLLALASRVFDIHLPVDLAATGCLSSAGSVERVGGLAKKVDLVAAEAPRVTRVLVPVPQVEEAEAAAGGRLKIIGVPGAAQALREVFGDSLERQLVAAGRDPVQRDALATAFFHLAVGDRGAMVDWTPVERAAAVALTEWPKPSSPLSDDATYRLRFAHAVAARHENNRGDLDLPPSGWLEQWPAPIRHGIVAHVVQHSADTGMPDARGAAQLAQAHLPVRLHDAFREQLRVAGALGRLEAVTGHPREALRRQREIAEAHAAALAWEDVSYPLCEWFRLAGALGDDESFAACDDLLARTIAEGALPPGGGPYVALARSRGELLLRGVAAPGRDTLAALEALSVDSNVPAHVRWSAVRWRVRCLDAAGDTGTAEGLVQALDEAVHAGGNDAVQATVYRALIDLDRALAAGNGGAADAAVKRLNALERGIAGHLGAVKECTAEYVARFYPY